MLFDTNIITSKSLKFKRKFRRLRETGPRTSTQLVVKYEVGLFLGWVKLETSKWVQVVAFTLAFSVSASHKVGHEFASRPGHTKDHHKNGTNCLLA